jgi:hypothetical protein
VKLRKLARRLLWTWYCSLYRGRILNLVDTWAKWLILRRVAKFSLHFSVDPAAFLLLELSFSAQLF